MDIGDRIYFTTLPILRFTGVNVGVKTRILQENSRALFVPCACHTMNLAVNDTAKLADNDTFKFFETVQKVFVFFSESPKRWAILQKFAADKKITLKNVSTTRWSSRESATKCLLYNLPAIHAALIEIANAPKAPGERNQSAFMANILAKKIEKFKFICGIVAWHNILSQINIVSKMLQSHSIDISNGLQLIRKVLNFLKTARDSDETIDEWFEKAKSIRSEIKFEPTAIDHFATQNRPNRVQRMPEEMEDFSEDDKERFKHSFAFRILDAASSKLEERFEQFEELSSAFEFLFDLHSKKISLEQCLQLEKKFTSEKDGKKDIDATQLFDEIKSFQVLVDDDKKKSPLNFLNKIQSLNLASIYPNLVIALRLFLTLPVTVASAESSFSKLKIIKNYLRTTMSQDRLTNLATISIESELLDSIPQESIIAKFAAAKARKIIFTTE